MKEYDKIEETLNKKCNKDVVSSYIQAMASIVLADSIIGRIAATVMGSSETTLYVLAVYLAATSVKDTRNVLYISLFSDFIAIILAVYLCRIF